MHPYVGQASIGHVPHQARHSVHERLRPQDPHVGMHLRLARQVLAAAEPQLHPNLAPPEIQRLAQIEAQAGQALLDESRPARAKSPALDPAIGAQRLGRGFGHRS